MKISHQQNHCVWVLLSVLLLTACKDAPPEGPAAEGPYSLCSYKDNLDAEGYASARLSYPCELDTEPLPAITLTGGYTNIKEQMYWLADHLTQHGYIVLTVTPNNIFGSVSFWEQAHQDAYYQLLDENKRPESPVANKIDITRIALAGYSNGGGGALEVANTLGDEIHSVVGMAPYIPIIGASVFDNVSANTLLLSGALDFTAFPPLIKSTHNNLSEGPLRLYAQFNGVSHFDWIALGRQHNKFKGIILSWLGMSLKNSYQYEDYLIGEEHQEHSEAGWYKEYLWNDF